MPAAAVFAAADMGVVAAVAAAAAAAAAEADIDVVVAAAAAVERILRHLHSMLNLGAD